MFQDSINISNRQLLVSELHALIEQRGGKITFADFMYQALYAPGIGYYSNGSQKFGAQGDFVTAPELGTLFAQCVAIQAQQILAEFDHKVILEIGAGSGKLAADLFKSLQANGLQLNHYYILELSAELQQRQQTTIKNLCPEFSSKITWLNTLPQNFHGVIIANEVVDAMPVQRFCWQNNILQELFVDVTNDSFTIILDEATPQLHTAFHERGLAELLGNTDQPYMSELNLWLNPWLKSLAQSLQRGAILLFDYGYGRAEYYHPQRNTGTLMCHYQHQCHPDPFFKVGEQDITAHVEFTALAEAASDNNLEVAGYTNQASFLLNCGLIDLIDPLLKQQQEINMLSSPAEMGELFKSMLLTKNLDLQAVGFSQWTKLHTL